MTVKTPILALVAVCVLGTFAASASAALNEGTGWEAYSQSYPTNLSPGGSGIIQLDLFNTGAKGSTGSITVTDALPAGLTATDAGGLGKINPSEFYEGFGTQIDPKFEAETDGGNRWLCTGNGSGEANLTGATVLTCTSNPTILPSLPILSNNSGKPEVAERVGIAVDVEQGAREGASSNRITVSGGGATSVTSVSDPLTIGSSEPGFGFPGWDVWFSNADGTLDTQAGSHPYAATFVNGFNELPAEHGRSRLAGEVRNLEAVLPPGFFGDPGAVPRCTREQLDANVCPAQTQIGVDGVGKTETAGGGGGGASDIAFYPVYNVVPPPGVADEFAFTIAGFDVTFDVGVRSSSGYPIVEHIDNIPQVAVDLNILTLWGVPAEASHDPERCEGLQGESGHSVECEKSTEVSPKPFLTLPTSCREPGEERSPAFTLLGLSTWENETARAEQTVFMHDSADTETWFTGCEKLSVLPSFSAVPDTTFADTPAGLTAEVKVPQETLELPNKLVAATLKNTSVTLPEGLVINPGQAAGLTACQAGDVEGGDDLPLPGENGGEERFDGPPKCPKTSKVGTVKIQTPLLEEELEPELEGNVYVLQSNPPELKLLVAASADGINLKLVGTVHLNEATGQLTTTFTETPELPFTDFKLTFSGGAQAALATPTGCGSYTTSSDFAPWTTPFAADVLGTDGFSIGAGPLGAPCPSSPLPFSPSLIAGATNPKGGAFTNFSLLLQRGDAQQRIDGLQFKAPPGLSGMISKVPLCTNTQAEANACPEASKIGHTVVESGPGPYPLVVPEPGQEPAAIYLTGPYNGSGPCTPGESGCAPFGLSIVVPLHVGPFTLETQRVRAKIEVDPHTAQITVTTNALPQIVDGVPTDLREVDAVIERPEFMFNPTHCEPATFAGTAYGTPPPGAGGPGTTASISSSFDVVGCKGLGFAPKFSVSTQGKTSKAGGASLTAKIAYPTGQGYANIAKVKVDLPKQLPSRLTTLQKACLATTFEANPASCPAASVIGHARALTPVLPVPLEGPAYFVSYGGEKFPQLVMVLQGYGVKIDLVGDTFISHAGITSSTFNTVPDQPVTSFELTLPEGKHSALAANGNLCTSKLAMPTAFVGQNGAEIHESTPIAVSGCPNSISISSHRVKGKTTTIEVSVPAAGKVIASGKGVSKASKTASGRETVSLVLNQKKAGKLKTNIKLTFTPSKGAKQSKNLTVEFKR